eukprot:CAMPEP_0180463408 /NCGR_PEP_ID=MMETSP1036_2-20121128/24909_1 /TAXON_ID=632150 /ORGANISM="Azadinium spinosum, Strain 3D9" /LENGTH=102 /DNA_ID=CAMNT_0022470219 /DNA_START=515 /DNA_END=820 /DNA_ORIENTATION=-
MTSLLMRAAPITFERIKPWRISLRCTRIFVKDLRVVMPLLGISIIHEEDLVDELHGGEGEDRANGGADLLPRLIEVGDDQGGPGERRIVELSGNATRMPHLR